MKRIVLWAGILLLVGAGCSERERVTRTDPTDPQGFVDRGWSSFETGNLTSALADFTEAIQLDPDFGPAYVGQGWARLGLATSTGAMLNAVQSFDDAAARAESGAEVRAGRAAAMLGAGGTSLASAATEAQAARAVDPQFQFDHRASFTVRDLFLIEAFARAGQGDLSAALAAAEGVQDSGIEAGNESTWVVDGTTFTTFEGAVLAFLHKLSEEHAG